MGTVTDMSPPTEQEPASSAPAARVAMRTAALAGAVSAAVALATGELVAGLWSATPSPTVGVANLIVARAPTDVVRFGIESFGRSDKPALLWGIAAATIALGACSGLLARGGGRRGRIAVLYGAFGLFGAWAIARYPQAHAGAALLTALAAAAVGGGLLAWLLHLAPTLVATRAAAPAVGRRSASPLDPPASRRSFLAWAGAGTAFAGAAAFGGRQLQQRSRTEAARAQAGASLPAAKTQQPATGGVLDGTVAGLSPYLTPRGDFYRIDTALLTPQVDLATWRLKVTGMVERPLQFSYDELIALDLIEEEVTLSCVSNEVGGSLVGNARWRGVRLADILARAGVDPAATQIVGRSVDGWTAGMPTAVALDGRPALVAVAMGDEPLPVRHGFPARLVVAGLYGYVSATKWLSELQLTRLEDLDGFWVPRGWAKEAPMKTQSRIDVPGAGARVAAGTVAVAGVAWAPVRGVQAVEVRVDDGAWQPARLGGTAGANTWVQWVFAWDAPRGRHRLTVRATDGTGAVQTADVAPPEPDGATGHHHITVEVG